MIDLEKVGKKIAILRRERGYTGERLAERLHVSPQAVSKWENARCLPETAILPSLAEALDCSIDALLRPGELLILEAVYTDGQMHIPVTHFVGDMVRDNRLNIFVNMQFIGANLESDRLKLLTVKYQTPKGVYYTYALQNENLILDVKESDCIRDEKSFQIIGAYYGNSKEYSSVMQKMEHYEYFKWSQIPVNHETFPSNTASDDTEYLTLVYLNQDGIHVISCPEGHVIYYGEHGTRLFLRDESKLILKDIIRLSWEEGMDCPWAGALYAALKYMGEPYTYHQIMGMSGACYRICFTKVWDFSCTDALVAFDYGEPLYTAIGYSFRMADRLEKQERKAERQAVMEDIRNGKPVLAINLRVAPEWGVITGYTDHGDRFLCRTYFDKEVFDAWEQEKCQNQESYQDAEERKMVFDENEGYLFNDFWPFLLVHFGEKEEKPSPIEILKTSLDILVKSFCAGECRGYYQGKGAYEAWIRGLCKESDFDLINDRENVTRRLSVNDNMVCHLIDSRYAAALWLGESISLVDGKEREYLGKIAQNCQRIADMMRAFRNELSQSSACKIRYNTVNSFGVSTAELREKQITLLEKALALDKESCQLAGMIRKQGNYLCKK